MTPSGYSPELRLLFDGQPAPAALRAAVTSIAATCGFGDADRLELGLANEGLRWLDHELFALDTPVELWLGYSPEQPERVFAGEVVGADANFPSGGLPTLRVIAQDRRTRLAVSAPSRYFAVPIPTVGLLPLPDLVVAPVLALEHGLLPVIDPVAVAVSAALGAADVTAALIDPKVAQGQIRKQAGNSSLDFLKQIAAENAWELVIDHQADPAGLVLTLMSPAAQLDPDVTLRYGQSLLDFSPRISSVGQVARVGVRVWVPSIGLELTVSVGYDWDRGALTVEVRPGFGMKGGATGVTLVNEPVSPANAARTIVSKLLPKLNKRLTAKGTCPGDAAIRAGHVLRIEGVGQTYGGFWRVTSVTQTIDGGGWRTAFEARKEVWFASIPAPAQGATPVPPWLPGLAFGG